MTTLTQTIEQKVQAAAKTIRGTSFIGMQYYINQQGEIANYTLIGGFSYERALEHDMTALITNKKEVIETLSKEYPLELVLKAYDNIFTSLAKRLSSDEVKQALREQGDATITKSDAQANAYITLAKGIRLHVETQKIHIFGLVVRKKVLREGTYKSVNSKELTIVQNKIKKLCGFKQDKVRTFIFDKGMVKIQGQTL